VESNPSGVSLRPPAINRYGSAVKSPFVFPRLYLFDAEASLVGFTYRLAGGACKPNPEYLVISFAKEKQLALETWERKLNSIITETKDTKDNVVSINSRKISA